MLKRVLSFLMIIAILFSLPVLSVSAKGINLVPLNEAQMNNISSWKAFEGGEVKQGTVGSENVLHASGLGTKTWHTPAYDIYNIIRTDVLKNGGGRYEISFSIALTVTDDGEKEISTGIRATNKTGLFDMPNNENDEFRSKLSVVFGKNGEWKDYSITIGIKADDVKNEGEQWLFCFDAIPKEVTDMYIDDFSVCRYSDDSQQTVLMHSCLPSKKFTSTNQSTPTQATPSSDKNTGTVSASKVTPSADKTETGKNLLDEKTSSLENVTALGQTKWEKFSDVSLSISDGGYSGKCLKATAPSVTWASPMIDVFPYIKEAGTYTFSIMMKVTGGKDETNYAFVIRGTRENSFIPVRGTIFYGSVASAKLKLGEWTRVIGQFTVKEEDIEEQDSWKLCISSTPLEVGELYLDEAVLIKGTEKQLPEMKEPDEGVIVNQGSVNKYAMGELYKPELKKAIITTSIITFIIVVLTISGKIFLLLKKGCKK